MHRTSLTDILAAQRAYAAARSQAAQSAASPNLDSNAAVRTRQQALLTYLQTRVRLLKTARDKILEQSDAEIARFQQKIGQVEQLLQQDTPAPPRTSQAEGKSTTSS